MRRITTPDQRFSVETTPSAQYLNDLQEETCAVIEYTGRTLDSGSTQQLRESIEQILQSNQTNLRKFQFDYSPQDFPKLINVFSLWPDLKEADVIKFKVLIHDQNSHLRVTSYECAIVKLKNDQGWKYFNRIPEQSICDDGSLSPSLMIHMNSDGTLKVYGYLTGTFYIYEIESFHL